jgi:hypothetical protein
MALLSSHMFHKCVKSPRVSSLALQILPASHFMCGHVCDVHKKYLAKRHTLHPSQTYEPNRPSNVDRSWKWHYWTLIYATINLKFVESEQLVYRCEYVYFCGICTHDTCMCISTENGNEGSSREGTFNNQVYKWYLGQHNILFGPCIMEWEVYFREYVCQKSALFGYVLQWQYKALKKDIIIYIITSLWQLILCSLT